MTHLYKGARQSGRGFLPPQTIVLTACGLRKPFSGARLPPDVTVSIGAVTCPECLAKAQSVKKAQ